MRNSRQIEPHLGQKWTANGASPGRESDCGWCVTKVRKEGGMVRHLSEKGTVDGASPRQKMDGG